MKRAAKSGEGRLAYADLLRVLATVAVLVLHVTCIWIYNVPVNSGAWAAYNVYNGLSRWCVPVFLMLSGMFMLEPGKNLTAAGLFRHILRIAAALVVWGAAYAVVDFGIGPGRLSWAGVRSALYTALLGNTHYHLWFLYAILGLYLATPILRAFVRGASRGDFHWFFLLCFLAAYLLPTLLRLRPSQTISLYLARLNLQVVLGYVGYYVAGYYLKTYALGRIAEAVIYLLGIAGAVATVGGTAVLSRNAGSLSTILYDYMTPNVAAMAIAVFTLCRYFLGVSEEGSRRRSISGLAKITFGIYLAHEFFLMLFTSLGVAAIPLPAAVAVPAVVLGAFLPSAAVAWLINKIPILGRYLT